MTDQTDQPDQPAQNAKPAVPTRKTGLSPAEQKMQAALEKAAQKKNGGKPLPGALGTSASAFSAKNSFAKKTAFQRKAT